MNFCNSKIVFYLIAINITFALDITKILKSQSSKPKVSNANLNKDMWINNFNIYKKDEPLNDDYQNEEKEINELSASSDISYYTPYNEENDNVDDDSQSDDDHNQDNDNNHNYEYWTKCEKKIKHKKWKWNRNKNKNKTNSWSKEWRIEDNNDMNEEWSDNNDDHNDDNDRPTVIVINNNKKNKQNREWGYKWRINDHSSGGSNNNNKANKSKNRNKQWNVDDDQNDDQTEDQNDDSTVFTFLGSSPKLKIKKFDRNFKSKSKTTPARNKTANYSAIVKHWLS